MLKIGEKIRELRKKLNVTQEKFAEYLGVTSQAVSRWEGEICYPDVEMFPAIANFFNISLDELFEADKKAERLQKMKEEIYRKSVQGYPLESIDLCRKALGEFPNNYDIMSSLLTELTNTDAKKNKDEIIELSERILNDCSDIHMKISTYRDMALFYKKIEDFDKAKAMAEKLPGVMTGVCCSEEVWLARVLQGEEKLFQSRRVIWTLAECLAGEISRLTKTSRDFCGGDNKLLALKAGANERIKMFEKAMQVLELIFSDKDYGFYNIRFKENYINMAQEYLILEEYDQALDCLEKSTDYLIAFEENTEEFYQTSFLVRGYTNTPGFWHNSPETLSYQTIQEYYSDDIFTPILEHEKFKAIIERLQRYAKTAQYE